MKIYGVTLHIQSKCGRIGTRKISNMDIFQAVMVLCLPDDEMHLNL